MSLSRRPPLPPKFFPFHLLGRSPTPWFKNTPTLPRLRRDLILQIAPQNLGIIPVGEADLEPLEKDGGHETDLDEGEVLAYALAGA